MDVLKQRMSCHVLGEASRKRLDQTLSGTSTASRVPVPGVAMEPSGK